MSLQVPALEGRSSIRRLLAPISGLLSLRYFVLRCFTAAGGLASGLLQTFVFARVVSARDFSIFVLIGSIGVGLWLFDLGAAKILYVRQRERHLTRCKDDALPAQSNAVVVLYFLIVLFGSALCFAVTASQATITVWQGVQFAAFFSFSALNLVWLPLRTVSNAIDEFITFEVLEAVRRIGHITMMLLLLVGLPLSAFLLLANLLWFAVFAANIVQLVGKGALLPRLRGGRQALARFWSDNRLEILSSANFAVSERVLYNFPYIIVPIAFGLGSPTIILDTVFKILRGAMLICSAGLDPLVPRQTRAFAEHDIVTLRKATWTATILCAAPTLVLCVLLLVAGDRFFGLLLGHAATMPREVNVIIVILLVANLAQCVASTLLVCTGFFREMARVAIVMVAATAAMTAIVLAGKANIVTFIAGYAGVYVLGAALYIWYVKRKIFIEHQRQALPLFANEIGVDS